MASSAQRQAGLVSRSVASCFLFKFPKTKKPQVALFRRSAKVSTYQHCLGPVAGSIEETDASPLAAVWREIREETTLTPAHLDLFRQGKPYSFTDAGVGRIWTVHPFAFRLKSESDESRIQIDWEHEGWEWHDPDTVTDEKGFGGVPFLAKSLRRVWFETQLGDERAMILREGLRTLRDDHESGARQLAGKALSVFREIVQRGEGEEDVQTWWANARMAAWHLWKNGRESMGAAILNVLLRSLAIIEKEIGIGSEVKGNKEVVMSRQRIDAISQRLDQFAKSRAEITGLWESFNSVLRQARRDDSQPIRILTLSFSSTIAECLKRVVATEEGLPLDIRILESRPLYEGVSLASQLAASKISETLPRTATDSSPVQVTVYSDASAAIASRDVDLVLLGADLVNPNGDVSNKTGSLPAVLSASHVSPGAKVVVVAENEKILPVLPASSHDEEENDPGELSRAWQSMAPGLVTDDNHEEHLPSKPRLEARNVYFEWVPSDLIDLYVSEDGICDSAGLVSKSESRKLEMDRLLGES